MINFHHVLNFCPLNIFFWFRSCIYALQLHAWESMANPTILQWVLVFALSYKLMLHLFMRVLSKVKASEPGRNIILVHRKLKDRLRIL